MNSIESLPPPTIAEVEAYQKEALIEVRIRQRALLQQQIIRQEDAQTATESRSSFNSVPILEHAEMLRREFSPIASTTLIPVEYDSLASHQVDDIADPWNSPSKRYLPSLSADVRPQMLYMVPHLFFPTGTNSTHR